MVCRDGVLTEAKLEMILEGLLSCDCQDIKNGVLYKEWERNNEKYILLYNTSLNRQVISVPFSGEYLKILYGLSPAHAALKNGVLTAAIPEGRIVLFEESSSNEAGLYIGKIGTDKLSKGVFDTKGRTAALYKIMENGNPELYKVFGSGSPASIDKIGEDYVLKLFSLGFTDIKPSGEAIKFEYNEVTEREEEFICDGSLEELVPSGLLNNWNSSEGYTVTSDNGNHTVLLTGDGNYSLWQKIYGLSGGEKYTFSAKLHAAVLKGTGAQVKLEFYNGDMAMETVVKRNYTETTEGFKEISFEFTAPEGATAANVLVRLLGGGEIYWDAISLRGIEAN